MDTAHVLRVDAHVENLSTIRRFIDDTAAALGVSPDTTLDMVQAVDEAVTNLIVHAYRGAPGLIEIDVRCENGDFVVYLRDQSPPFDPNTVPPPDLSVPLAKRRLGGLGVHLMRQFTDRMLYHTTPEGINELKLVKRLAGNCEPG